MNGQAVSGAVKVAIGMVKRVGVGILRVVKPLAGGGQEGVARDAPGGEVSREICRGCDRPSGISRWGGQADCWGSQEGVARDAPVGEVGFLSCRGRDAPVGEVGFLSCRGRDAPVGEVRFVAIALPGQVITRVVK